MPFQQVQLSILLSLVVVGAVITQVAVVAVVASAQVL
jgi:hypothetical protein